MPWQEQSQMSLRHEFVTLADADGANIRALCRRFGISPTTGYTWLERFRRAGVAGLADHSRRPHRSPAQTEPAMEARVVALRDAHPAWGSRKLGTVLARLAVGAQQLGQSTLLRQRVAHEGWLVLLN